MPRTDAVSRTVPKPRFAVVSQFTTIFADRLRLSVFDDLNQFFIGIHAVDPETADPHQSLVTIDLPKKDRSAYQRAAAAFNAIVDEHEQRERERRVGVRVAKLQAAATISVMLLALGGWPLVMAHCAGLV